MIISRLNVYNEKELKFMYETRFHPEVMKTLLSTQNIPTFEQHIDYLRKKDKEDYQLFYICWINLHNNNWAIPVGYCQCKMIQPNVWELGWVIHPDEQGHGFGKKSVDMLLSEIKQMGAVSAELVVVKENKKAIYIYESFGFKIDGDCGNAWRMCKFLD